MQNVDTHTLHSWITSGDVTIVDVRSDEEYANGHIKECLHLPLDRLEGNIPDTSQPLVLYCHAGKRSKEACRIATHYHDDCWNLLGGICEWIADGYPVTKD